METSLLVRQYTDNSTVIMTTYQTYSIGYKLNRTVECLNKFLYSYEIIGSDSDTINCLISTSSYSMK